MSERLYPVELADVQRWATRNLRTVEESRRRFIQFVILQSLGDDHVGPRLAFKGGNALRFCYQSPRSTLDLDFTALEWDDDLEVVQSSIDRAVRLGSERLGVKAKVQSARRKPPGSDKEFPTYDVRVGYRFPEDHHYVDFLETDRSASSVVRVEVSFNDVVCEVCSYQLSPDPHIEIKVCVLEDIMAEKLRAILQQEVRNRNRPQDVFDLARLIRSDGHSLDRAKVAHYFKAKCDARGLVASAHSFDEEARTRSEVGYAELRSDVGADFIEFREAWTTILEFVRDLDLD